MGTQPPAAIKEASQDARRMWRIPACLMGAQWALESGWGRLMPIGSNNPFGEKQAGDEAAVQAAVQAGKATWAGTREVLKGKDVHIQAPFMCFASLEAAFDSHAQHLATSSHYAKAYQILVSTQHRDGVPVGVLTRKLVEAYIRAIAPVYATDPHYADLLMRIINGSNLWAWDGL